MVRAPFILHTVTTSNGTGQAAGKRWYLAPFRLWRRPVYINYPFTKAKISWDYALGEGQYLGSQLFYAGKSTWRQS